MSFVYVKFETALTDRRYGVGFHYPDGRWHPESSHVKRSDAIARMRWLNGACGPEPGTGQDTGCCRCGGSAVTS